MDKKQLHHLWTKIRPIKVWYLLVPLVIVATVAVFSLRQNNLEMVRLRQAVYAADEQNNDVEGALKTLRSYVYGHMNTSLTTGNDSVYPPIQLKYTYQRLQDAANTKSQQDNASVYSQAQAYCEQQNSTDFSGRNRVPCIEKYVSEHGGSKPTTIPDALYKFDFVSPRWSPDVAGFSLALAVLLLILTVLRIAAGYLLKRWTK